MDWLQWFINFLIKKYLAPGESVRNEVISNEELAKELHKPVIRTFDKRKLHSPFIDIVSPDPADIQSIKNIISKDKKVLRLLMIFRKFQMSSAGKPSKVWVEKSSEVYNRSMKSFLQNTHI